jgi:hypothetical protein
LDRESLATARAPFSYGCVLAKKLFELKQKLLLLDAVTAVYLTIPLSANFILALLEFHSHLGPAPTKTALSFSSSRTGTIN